MARCGCADSACNCVITAGPGITVTGNGTPGSNYVVSAADQGVLQVVDSSSIDFTLTGEGEVGDPYELTAAAKISPIDGNLLNVDASGLYVDCADIAACVPPAGNIELGCGLEGIGSEASPLAVKGLVPWDFACAESEAQQLYCLADGSIAAPPPNRCISSQIGLGAVVGMAGFCTLVPATAVRTRLSSQPGRTTFTNTDPCRSMILEIKASGVIQMTGDNADGTNPNQWVNQIIIGLMINGVTGAGVQQHGILANGFIDYRIDYPPIIVPPLDVVQIGSFVDGQADVACHVEAAYFQHPNIIMTGRTCG